MLGLVGSLKMGKPALLSGMQKTLRLDGTDEKGQVTSLIVRLEMRVNDHLTLPYLSAFAKCSDYRVYTNYMSSLYYFFQYAVLTFVYL